MRIEIYSALDMETCLETTEWAGTFEAYLDATIPQWRAYEVQRFAAYVGGLPWGQASWGDTLPADTVVRLNLIPMGGIFKAIGNIIGKLFSFLGFGGSNRGGSQETPDSRELDAASGKANTAKLSGVVPELAGRFRRFPDYLTPPRRYFVNKREQWLVFLANIGPGLHDVHPSEVRVGDTSFAALGADAAYTVYAPGADLSAVIPAQIWYTSPGVGSTSSGSAGLELTTEPANRVNSDPATYSFSGGLITRSSGFFPDGWGIGTEINVEYQRPYVIADFNLPPLYSNFTGYFAHLPSLAVGSLVKVGAFESNVFWKIAAVTFVSGGTYTIRFADATTDMPIHVAASGGTAYIFGSDVKYPIVSFDSDSLAVAPSTFETGVTMASRIRYAGGTVYGEWSSEFLATPPGAVTSLLELDTFFPQGLCFLTDTGGLQSRSVSIEYQYRNSAGGGRTTLRYTYSDATVDQIGFTEQISIPSQAPLVRARRVGAQSTSTQVQDKCQWYGLKTRLPNHTIYPRWTTIAISMRSGGKLASQSENQVNVTATRILPTLQSNGTWGSPVATRDISAFARYILNSAGVPDSQIDMEELRRLHAIWAPRVDTLDFVFDATTVKEALEVAFGAGMGEFTCGDGLVRPVREDVRTEFEQSYSPHNMTRPLRRTISSHSQITDFDGVDVEYTDNATWAKETVQCRFPGDLGAKVQKITLEGVTNRTRAWRIGMRRRGEQVYRRKEYSFNTELDALNSVYMGYVALFDSYGQTGLITGIRSDGAGGAIITSSEEMKWSPGVDHVLGYRSLDGNFRGPFAATPGPSPYEVRAVLPMPWPSVSMSHELPHLYFGTVSDFGFPALVTAVNPRGQFEVSVSAVNYDARVYAYDNASPPA